MTLGIFKIGLKSSRKEKKLQVFCLFLWFIILVGKKTFGIHFWFKTKISLLLFHFWCYTIGKFVLQVGNVSSLDIWGFLRFVLGDLVYFCEVFSSCDLQLGVFVRLMLFGHFVNSFGDSGRNWPTGRRGRTSSYLREPRKSCVLIYFLLFYLYCFHWFTLVGKPIFFQQKGQMWMKV